MKHLSLEILNHKGTGSKFFNLEEDASITITDTSEIFDSGDVWSLSFALNVFANLHIFGTCADMHGARLHEQIDKQQVRLWVDGVPLYIGYLRLGDEVEMDENGNVDVIFESGQKTFEQMTEGAKANQVPMMRDVKFGLALWRKRWTCVNLKLTGSADFLIPNAPSSLYSPLLPGTTVIEHTVDPNEIGDEEPYLTPFSFDGEDEGNSVQQYPRMVFPKGKFDNLKTGVNDELIDCLNTDTPYDESHPYCNIALCYQRYGYEKKQKDGSLIPEYNSEPEAQRGYEYMPANRVNSAPNFFVIYWIQCLMSHLGIHIEENQMTDVEDLRRLFFVNTNCAYKEPKYLRNKSYDMSLGKYRFGSNGDLVPEYFGKKSGRWFDGPKKIVKTDDFSLICTDISAGEPFVEYPYDVPDKIKEEVEQVMKDASIERVTIKSMEVAGMSEKIRMHYDGYGPLGLAKKLARNRFLHDAIATSECFPNVDISEVISAIESGFGVRLLFSDSYKRVRIVLLRNIFRDNSVQDIVCEVVSEGKVENGVRGFRMTYGKTDDTSFYYKGFADKLPHKKPYFVDDSDKHDYSHWDLNADYGKLIHKITAFDKTCYIDNKTGNSYGIKIDKDAKKFEELHPSLFEFADYMDAEDGDCTGEDESIKTINVGFTPAIMNDVNFEEQRDGNSREQRFALFVDATMRPRRPNLENLPEDSQPGVKSYNDADAKYSVDGLYDKYGPGSGASMTAGDGVVKPGEFAITSDMSARKNRLSATLCNRFWLDMNPYQFQNYYNDNKIYVYWPVSFNIEGHISDGYRLYLQDDFEPNDDGISPIETKDWGLTLGIMRGSGRYAHVDYSTDPDDKEENRTWKIIPGNESISHPDTCDSYGNEWDYNGQGSGIGPTEGRISLKLRAEKPYPYYDQTLPDIIVTRDQAAKAMQKLFITSDADLLDRPVASNATMREAGWDVPGDGYATVYGMDYDVTCDDGKVHKILWTPIRTNGVVMTQQQLENYIATFNGLPVSGIEAADVLNMVLDIDTTERRAQILHQLQALYYADQTGWPAPSVDISPLRYMEISNPNLRGRGLCDEFYKEYSYWIRNARIAKRTVKIELAQLLSIDKTKKIRIGDITGFLVKMQYTISNLTGLGEATMEIMYI